MIELEKTIEEIKKITTKTHVSAYEAGEIVFLKNKKNITLREAVKEYFYWLPLREEL